MMKTTKAAFCIVAALCTNMGWAQQYPSRAIRWVEPSAPGATSDIVARLISDKLGAALGTTLGMDNRPGAAGNIAAEIVAKSAPDGYTLLTGIFPHAVNPSLYPKLSYDLLTDLAPIVLISSAPLVVVVHPSLPVKTVKELVALAKRRPGELSFPSGGNGSSSHLAGELLKNMAGIDLLHVPYKSIPQSVLELTSGRTSLMINPYPTMKPFITSGKLRSIAVTSLRRSHLMPELPTVDEAGLPGYTVTAWHGMLTRGGTPAEIIARLNGEITKLLRVPEMRARLDELGFNIVESTPEQFAQHLRGEVDKWAKVVKASGIRAD